MYMSILNTYMQIHHLPQKTPADDTPSGKAIKSLAFLLQHLNSHVLGVLRPVGWVLTLDHGGQDIPHLVSQIPAHLRRHKAVLGDRKVPWKDPVVTENLCM